MRFRNLLAVLLVLAAFFSGCTSPTDSSPAARFGSTPAATMSPSPTAAPATAAPTAAPASPGPTTVATAPGEFRVQRAMSDVRVLASDIGRREAGTEGDAKAAAWIRDQLDALDLEASLQEFPLPQGGVSWNVVGHPPALDPERDRYLIVGGHYDSINGPGANDNATGIAVALESARAVAERPSPLPVVVVAFGAEERQPAPGRPHHVGSRHYVEQMSEGERRNLVAFVNVDMVGYGDSLICGRMDVGPREATDRLLRLANELGIPARERVTPNWSDNGSFLTEGMNAGWLWTGEDPAYHSPRDTYDHVQPPAVQMAGRLALAALRSYS